MKIYIKSPEYISCSIAHARKYDKIRPSEVTRLFLKYAFRDSINAEQLRILVEGILAWKRDKHICYHHVGLDTKDNRASNIALVLSNAHGTLHNPSNELKLYRHYGLVIPGYMQGPKAEQLERKMYRMLFADIKSRYGEISAVQIIDAITPLVNSGNVFTKDDVKDNLNKSSIRYISLEDIRSLLDNLNFDSESIASVDYVDEITGKRIISMLNEVPIADEYSKHTVDCIIDFIQSNQLSRYQIDKYCKKLGIT